LIWVKSSRVAAWQLPELEQSSLSQGHAHMKERLANSVVGYLMIPLCLLGLLLASRAVDAEMELFGFSLAAFSFLFGFSVIKGSYDREDAVRAKVQQEDGHE
jgi:hypothetical protein